MENFRRDTIPIAHLLLGYVETNRSRLSVRGRSIIVRRIAKGGGGVAINGLLDKNSPENTMLIVNVRQNKRFNNHT